MLQYITIISRLSILCIVAICQVSKAFVCVPQSKINTSVTAHSDGHQSFPQPDSGMNQYQYTNKSIVKAPIYITIGPQCSGKTSFLRRLYNTEASIPETQSTVGNQHVHSTPVCDISIDDQKGVYLPIPKELFLVDSSTTNSLHQDLLARNIHSKSIAERIYDTSNDEQRYILQRLHNVINADEFAQRIFSIEVDKTTEHKWNLLMGCNDENENYIDYRRSLIEVVEHTCQKHYPPCTDKVDLFIVESIFRNKDDGILSFLSEQSNHNDILGHESMYGPSLSGLSAAVQNLKHFACHPKKMNMPLAWGNTNTKPRDYIAALEAAEMSGRPVYFIPYMDVEKSMIHSHDGLILPKVSVVSLLERNIKRLVTTGRYIPSRAIIDASVRVDEMMNRAMTDLSNTKNASRDTRLFTQLELDMTLTRHAGGFQMNRHNRTIQRIQERWGERRDDGSRQGQKRLYEGYNTGRKKWRNH